MDAASATASARSLTASYERLFLSSLRLSSAATLFGVQQVESALNGWQEGGGIGKQMEQVGDTVNSLTQCLMEQISPGKRQALHSISEVSNSVMRQSIEGMRVLDPFAALKFAGNVAQKSTETVASWTKKPQPPTEEEPHLAADVLGN